MTLHGDLISQSKGQFAQALVTTLLEYSGYLVRRVGVEEVVADVKRLQGWDELDLPAPLRAMPDLLVIAEETRATKLVEVKFRRRFDAATARELSAALGHQRTFWPDSWAVLVVGEPPRSSGQYQDHIRVVRPEDAHLLDGWEGEERRWWGLPTLGAVFHGVHAADGFHQAADRLVGVLHAWARA